MAITEEEERKCQPVQTQNIEKVNIVEHAAMIHRDFKSLIFHLMTKIVMRTENGTTLIHLCDKHHNESGSVQASNIRVTDLWSLFCNRTQTPTAHLEINRNLKSTTSTATLNSLLHVLMLMQAESSTSLPKATKSAVCCPSTRGTLAHSLAAMA